MSIEKKSSGVYTKELLRGQILTVKGIMSPEKMGMTLPHEHLIIKHQGPDVDIVDVDLVIEDIKKYVAAGGRTLVEMTNEKIGRDPAAFKRISEETGLNVIMGCGYYKDAWIPYEARNKTADVIAQEIVNDIFIGVPVDGEYIHSGQIGEIGISRNMTQIEENSLRGSARAQKATGAALSIHFDFNTTDREYDHILKILDEEGVDNHRVVFNHVMAKIDDIDRIIRLAKTGVNLTFDNFGIEIDDRMVKFMSIPMEEQLVTIKALLKFGLIDHMMLSQDVCFKGCLTANGGFGYTHLLDHIVPFLHKLNINDYDIERMIIFNARKVFTFGGRYPSY